LVASNADLRAVIARLGDVLLTGPAVINVHELGGPAADPAARIAQLEARNGELALVVSRAQGAMPTGESLRSAGGLKARSSRRGSLRRLVAGPPVAISAGAQLREDIRATRTTSDNDTAAAVLGAAADLVSARSEKLTLEEVCARLGLDAAQIRTLAKEQSAPALLDVFAASGPLVDADSGRRPDPVTEAALSRLRSRAVWQLERRDDAGAQEEYDQSPELQELLARAADSPSVPRPATSPGEQDRARSARAPGAAKPRKKRCACCSRKIPRGLAGAYCAFCARECS